MTDTEMTKDQLIQELTELRQRMAELEAEKDARQHAEEALRESEYKLRGLIENSTDAIRLFNEEGVIEVWNPASEALYGIPAEQAVGRFIWDIGAELRFEDFREQALEVLRTGLIPDAWKLIEFTIEHPNGSTRHIQAKAFMIPTEKGYWGASIHRDISERFTTEKVLRESEVKYRELVENMHDTIYIVDENYRVTYISPAIESFLGYPPSEILGKPFTQFIYPDDLPRIRERYRVITMGDNYSGPNDYRAVAKSGEIRWMRLSTRPVVQDDRVIGAQGVLTDITEQKQTEEAYRNLVDHSLQALAIFQDEQIVFCNPAYATMRGYTIKELFSRPPEQLFDYVHPEDRERVRMYARDRLAGKPAPEHYELRLIRKDGDVRWCESYHTLIQYRGKQATQSLFIDITERKAAEAGLRESEARYRALAGATLEGISITEKGIIIDVNDRFCEMFGYARDEVIGKHVWDFIPSEDRELVQHHIHSGYDRAYEHQMIKKDDSIITVEVHGKNIVYQGHPARITIIRDITERKQIEQVLREGEAKFKTLVDASPVATAIIREDRFLYVNPAWEDATGYEKSEALAMNPQILFHPAMREEVFQQNAARLKGEAVPSRYEAQIVTQDGRVRWFGFTATSIVYENIPAVLTVSADITDRKQAQQHHLALALEKERVQILSNFITQASHEFRTPLSIINTSAYLLKRQSDFDAQQPHIHNIEEQVAHIAQLITDLSLMADLDSIQHLEVTDIDLIEVVQTIVNVLQATFQEKSLHIVLELPDTPLLIPANYERLRQAVERILDNAIRHTPEAGTITVRCQPAASNASLEIIDTGSGIRDKNLPRVFERFYRADEAGTTRGFGLGLPIAKAIVDLHQGRIEVESTEGEGSTFRILLPLA